MGFTLGVLFESILLFINALAILHEERFLKPRGWCYSPDLDPNSIRTKLLSLLHAVQLLLKIPLIICNVVVIMYELLLG